MTFDEILSTLRSLECELHRPKARRDAERLAQLLHPDFHEFGRSGRSCVRSEILEQVPAEPEQVKMHAQDFRLVRLAESVYLLTYRSAQIASSGVLENHSNRSSVWRLEPVGWQMVFHQGTPTESFAREPEST